MLRKWNGRLESISKGQPVNTTFFNLNEVFSLAAEDDEEKRISYLSTGINQVTEVLPFESQNIVLVEDRELVKYLLLCLPEAPSSVSFECFS